MEAPYGVAELRHTRIVTDDTVTCHVAQCRVVVERQRRRFRREARFFCPCRRIYVSPSTYDYQDRWRNLLWRDESDRSLMSAISKVKRTTVRLGRERDEDAVTWNVVRPFQREGRLDRLAQLLLAGHRLDVIPSGQPTIIYWGSDETGGRWEILEAAQREFHEVPNRGTEPDVVLWWPGQLLVFVEAKFCATNRTPPSRSSRGPDHRPWHYGQHPHFQDVFKVDYEQIVERSKRYELMRLWLLGSWVAREHGIAFCLVNLQNLLNHGERP